MKSFLKYLKPYTLLCVMAPLLKMLEATFELIVPLVIASLIDNGIAKGDKTSIAADAVLLFALSLVGLIAAITAQYFSAKTAMNFGGEVRRVLFNKIEKLSFRDLDEVGTSSLVTRMTVDVNQMQNGVNMILRLLLRSPFIVFGATIMAVRINAEFAGTFFMVLLALFIVVIFVVLISVPLLKRVSEKMDTLTLKVRENIVGVRVVRAFNKSEEEEKEVFAAVDNLEKMQLIVGRISSILNPATLLIVNAGIVILLYSGGMRVNKGTMIKGDVVAIYNYMSMILIELIKFVNFVYLVSKMLAGAQRAEKVLNMDVSVKYPEETNTSRENNPNKKTTSKKTNVNLSEKTNENEDTNFIEFKNVCASYGEGEDAISDVTFAANKGEVVGVIGGTGSGKSTLVNLIPRFYDINSGSITIDGVSVVDYSKEDLNEMISIAMQKAVMFSGSVADNLRIGKEDADNNDIIRALKLSESYDFVFEKEGNIDYKIVQGGKNLSGGQRQRLSIARALIKDSDILIFDDSFSALDFATEAKLRNNIDEIKKDKVIFLVSQRISSLKKADRILVLDRGNLVGIGSEKELLETCEVYREIWESQSGTGDGSSFQS